MINKIFFLIINKILPRDEKHDITPQKITINRKIITNKMKNKNCFSSTNVSMKNINNIHQKNKRNGFEENKNLYQNSVNSSSSNKMINNHNNFMNVGEIYTHKKKHSLIGIESNNNDNCNNTGENFMKKNNYINSNITINNINNYKYFNLIQGAKPEIKIIKKKINKNY